jgi:8-oxo-dGTP pyrophosphatase MutT (NUDIX family)
MLQCDIDALSVLKMRSAFDADCFSALMARAKAGLSATSRLVFPAHFTASAVVLNAAQSHFLLIHHPTLHRWFQPGGHIDDGEGFLQAALRESEEECGLTSQSVIVADEVPFDYDLHKIPANEAKAEPEHWHFDVRFRVVVDENLLKDSPEALQLRWIARQGELISINSSSLNRADLLLPKP